jgi:acyl carrier protein
MRSTFSKKNMGLDGVELVLSVEETFGISIPDSVAFEMTTPAMMISFVQQAVSARPERKACISQRAFHKVRASLMKATGVGRRDVTLKTPIKRLFSGPQRTDHWRDFKGYAGLHDLPNLGFVSGWLFGPTTVKDLVSGAISVMSDDLREERSWTNEEVRQIVRQIISDQLGVEKFKDTDEFVRDLGLD